MPQTVEKDTPVIPTKPSEHQTVAGVIIRYRLHVVVNALR